MKYNILSKAVVLVLSGLMLAGCAHNKKNGANGRDGSSSSRSGYASRNAETSGAGYGNKYNGAGSSGRRALASKNTIYFDFDRSYVREADRPLVYAKAEYLMTHPNAKIILEGHTDPRGSREYNIGLGERRAQSVAELLKSRGVKPSQIRIVSYGSQRLAADGRTEADFQLDRRAVFAKIRQG